MSLQTQKLQKKNILVELKLKTNKKKLKVNTKTFYTKTNLYTLIAIVQKHQVKYSRQKLEEEYEMNDHLFFLSVSSALLHVLRQTIASSIHFLLLLSLSRYHHHLPILIILITVEYSNY